ncbi:MAG: ATP-dependent DNA helicase, partial [Planctomycetota bacterium]
AGGIRIITGGAGTGKTTIIEQIARRIGSDAILCAFAGKAAARLREATGYSASTIHRMLMWQGERFALESLRHKSVIIDEASMPPSDLMAEIVTRNPERLILVGDRAQLPPVGMGQPFHDLISHMPELVYELSICWRQSEAVYRAATAIRNGEQPLRSENSALESWEIRGTGTPEDTHHHILEMVREGLLEFAGGKDIILCPRNGTIETPSSVAGLNDEIVKIVNPRSGDSRLQAGDRVMNTKNLAEKDVWNGTTGTVISVAYDGEVYVELDFPTSDGLTQVQFTKGEARDLQLAYAISVHKSQGSQYRRVVFVALHRDAWGLLDRNLIYTAVTRTQKECVVVGQPSAFQAGIQRERPRTTVLQQLMGAA